MVDPDLVAAVEGDTIASPDVLRVELGDVNVLDDDVLGAVDAQTLTTDDTGITNTNNGLVGAYFKAVQAGVVVRAGCGLVTITPADAVFNGILARLTAGVGVGNAALAVSALITKEAELLVNENDTGLVIGEPLRELCCVRRGGRRCITTTSGT